MPFLEATIFEHEHERKASCEGGPVLDDDQGLKPLAESFRPFGTRH
jgi:hypothetical protein